jgi:hypothetical protein
LTAKIADVSGTIFVQFMGDMGNNVMNGTSARDFKDLKEAGSFEDVKEFLNSCCYKVRSYINSVTLIIGAFNSSESNCRHLQRWCS